MRWPRSRFDFNCGGYALGTLDWYSPYSNYYDSMEEMIYDENGYEINGVEYQDSMVEYMLNTLDNVRIAKDEYDCGKDERIVAFRCGEDDFHFVRKESDGTFTHKPGSHAIEPMTREQFYDPRGWDFRYDGPIVFLAIADKEEDAWRQRRIKNILESRKITAQDLFIPF